MKIISLITLLFTLVTTSYAQPVNTNPPNISEIINSGTTSTSTYNMDCETWTHPGYCELLREAFKTCNSKSDQERGRCVRQLVSDSPMKHTCSKITDPKECDASYTKVELEAAVEICRDAALAERNRCIAERRDERWNKIIDCSHAEKKDYCEAKKNAYLECKGMEGEQRRTCWNKVIGNTAPPKQDIREVDCSKTTYRENCEAYKKATLRFDEICKGKLGADLDKCFQENLGYLTQDTDCRRSRDPARCEAIKKMRLACAGKSGDTLDKCMQEEEQIFKRRRQYNLP